MIFNVFRQYQAMVTAYDGSHGGMLADHVHTTLD